MHVPRWRMCKAGVLQSGIQIDVDRLHSPVGLLSSVPQCYQVCEITSFELMSKGKCLLHAEKCPPRRTKSGGSHDVIPCATRR